jgi:hypothetical protein
VRPVELHSGRLELGDHFVRAELGETAGAIG